MTDAASPSRRARGAAAILGGLLIVAAGCDDPAPAPPAQAPAAFVAPDVAPPADINREFLSADLDPAAWLGKFEVESREVYAARDAIVAVLGLTQGDRIADVGSGTGLFLEPMSRGVGPAGRVYAVDISPRLVEFIERRVAEEDLANVAVVRSTETSTMLPPASVGHVFVCDTYHHFERYPEMLASIRDALLPGGWLTVVDFERIPGVSREWLLEHVRADKETVRDEIEAAGFEFVDEVDLPALRENYLLRFRRPGGAAPQP